MATPRIYLPLSRVALRLVSGVVAVLTVANGVMKLAEGLPPAYGGTLAEFLSRNVLVGLGVAEIVLAFMLLWPRTTFVAALLLIADYANHMMALVAVGRPMAAAAVILIVNVLAIVLWAWRPRFLGGRPSQFEVALVD